MTTLIDELETEKSHSDGMAAMAAYWMERALSGERDSLRTLIAIVNAAGGDVVVPYSSMCDLDRLTLHRIDQPEDNSIRLAVRPNK